MTFLCKEYTNLAVLVNTEQWKHLPPVSDINQAYNFDKFYTFTDFIILNFEELY